MQTTWYETAMGEVVFEHRAPRQARLIGAAMLAFFPVFFGYYLVTGLVEYARGATASQWLAAAPGFVLLLALFLAFALPIWYILLGRDLVVLDRASGRLVIATDLRLYRRSRSFPLDQLGDVVVKQTARNWRIELTHSGPGKRILVGLEETGADAQELARRLAAELRHAQVRILEPEDDPDLPGHRTGVEPIQ